MNWDLLASIPLIFLVLGMVVCLWGTGTLWKHDNKFLAIVFFVMAVALGIVVYSLYGNKIF